MIDELLGGLPVFRQPPEEPPIIPNEVLIAPQAPSPPDTNQVQALDALFTETQDPSAAACLLGLWSSAMLLGDLAGSHLRAPAAADEPQDDQQPAEEEV
jgi:hypothetical protein